MTLVKVAGQDQQSVVIVAGELARLATSLAGERAAACNKSVVTNKAPFRDLTQDKRDTAV